MKIQIWQVLVFFLALTGCDQEQPTPAAPPSGGNRPPAAPLTTPAAKPTATEPAVPVLKTADGEFVGSSTADYLGGKACIELYLSGRYAPDLVFDAKRNLAEAGTFSDKPCDPATAMGRCKTLRPDGEGLVETLIGYYYGITPEDAQADCDKDGGEFSAL